VTYFLCTQSCPENQIGALSAALRVDKWCYLGSDPIVRLALSRAQEGRAEWVSVSGALNDVSRELRTPFLDLIGSLSVQNTSPLWWSTELAAKNPYTSSLFLHICFLKIGIGLLIPDGKDFLVVTENPEVLRQLKRIAQERGLPAKDLTPRTLLRRCARRCWTGRRWPSPARCPGWGRRG